MEKNDLAWNLYLSEREFIKHHENQRTTASNILAAIAAGLIVALGTDELSIEISILISFLLAVMGFFGYVFCGKLYALIMLHAGRSYEYLKILDTNYKEIDVVAIKKLAKTKNKERFKRFGKLGLNTIWRTFHLFICLTGVGLFIFHTIKLFI
ncbi:hypothetical protein [Olleya aquimaris]|uniref:Uncharacterized protein n=1 Tax=Olleya aquimaris TaxID=639310 RepID=A0A327R4M0_9FLAO|nr:hypothetical protein [Olleya aquimaris]RAJ11759.1 hypothetical protein LY08_02689 [Olleya aquimaris]